MIRYHDISVEENDFLYGPGKRVVIWVKGCSLRCEGCTNPHLWEREGGKDISAADLVDVCLKDGIDGITLHGGEPTEQLDELLPAVREIHAAGKSVILFTGYEIEELTTKRQKEFLSFCDLIICGRFEIAKLNRYLHFRGSDNQRIIKNGERLRTYEIRDGHNVVLIQFSENGALNLKGFPDEEINTLLGRKENE